MKKLLLLVVLALGACTTLNAQSSVQRSLQDINRTMEEISRLQRNIEGISANTSRREARRAPKYDYHTGLKFKEKGGNVYYLETKELIIEVNNFTIEFFRADSGTYITSMNRREYGRWKVATGLTTAVKKNIVLYIENDASNTMFSFIIGDTVIMNKWAPQPQPKYPRFANRPFYPKK